MPEIIRTEKELGALVAAIGTTLSQIHARLRSDDQVLDVERAVNAFAASLRMVWTEREQLQRDIACLREALAEIRTFRAHHSSCAYHGSECCTCGLRQAAERSHAVLAWTAPKEPG